MLFKFALLAKHYPKWLCRLILDNELTPKDLEIAIECLGLTRKNRRNVEQLLLNLLQTNDISIKRAAIFAAFHLKSYKILDSLENIFKNDTNEEIKFSGC